MIRTAGLARSYPMGGTTVQALREATLSVHPGEFVAIRGRQGQAFEQFERLAHR